MEYQYFVMVLPPLNAGAANETSIAETNGTKSRITGASGTLNGIVDFATDATELPLAFSAVTVIV